VPFRRDEGSALMTDLLVASVVILIVASATMAVGTIDAATQASREATRAAAVITARTGDPATALGVARRLGPPGAHITVDLGDDAARATASTDVDLPHPVTGTARIRVVADSSMTVAPYRSNRG
jgi:hypothetical protein